MAPDLAEVILVGPDGVAVLVRPGGLAIARIGHGVCRCAAEAERRQDAQVTVDRQYRSVILGRWHWKQRWQTRLLRALFARHVVQRVKRIGVPAFGHRNFVDQRRLGSLASLHFLAEEGGCFPLGGLSGSGALCHATLTKKVRPVPIMLSTVGVRPDGSR